MDRFVARVVFVSFVIVIAFAAVFTVVDARPAGWPNLPPFFGRNLDLFAGFAFCAFVVVLALRGGRQGREKM
ncbi:MAG: hypothetical protein ACRD16_04045 [Thermoanaerobaculia bacterium]